MAENEERQDQIAKQTDTVLGALSSQKTLARVQEVIPEYLRNQLTAERMVRVARLIAFRTPKLQECSVASVIGAVIDAARLGLDIGRECHMVPFKLRQRKMPTCTLLMDYRGYHTLAYRSGRVAMIDSQVVYEGDTYEVHKGTNPHIIHIPDHTIERPDDAIIGVYSFAYLKDSEHPLIEDMTPDQVAAIRKRSRASDTGPWVTDYAMMARKTVDKRLCDKKMPQTPELFMAVELDNRFETGKASRPLEGETEEEVSQHALEETKQRVEELKGRIDQTDDEALAEDAKLAEEK